MLQPIWNDVWFSFLVFLFLWFSRENVEKKNSAISGMKAHWSGDADQMVFICTFIAMYVFIGHVCWKRKRDEDTERSSCAQGTLFFGGNEELIGRMQANVAEKGRGWKSPRSNLTIAKASEAFSTYIFKLKSTPPRAFLNVFRTISKGGKHTHYSRRIGIRSPMLRGGPIILSV